MMEEYFDEDDELEVEEAETAECEASDEKPEVDCDADDEEKPVRKKKKKKKGPGMFPVILFALLIVVLLGMCWLYFENDRQISQAEADRAQALIDYQNSRLSMTLTDGIAVVETDGSLIYSKDKTDDRMSTIPDILRPYIEEMPESGKIVVSGLDSLGAPGMHTVTFTVIGKDDYGDYAEQQYSMGVQTKTPTDVKQDKETGGESTSSSGGQTTASGGVIIHTPAPTAYAPDNASDSGQDNQTGYTPQNTVSEEECLAGYGTWDGSACRYD